MVLMILSLACSLTSSLATIEPPTADFQEATLSPTGWIQIAPGIEYREIEVEPQSSRAFNMQVVRIDPNLASFEAIYEPNNALSSPEWQRRLTSANVIINANFFSDDNETIGMVVSNGQLYGTSFLGYGGMFMVHNNGALEVRSLVQSSYYGEPLTQAVQGFPLLVEYGGVSASTGAGFDDPARRTMIAQDRDGYILLFSTGLGQLSLREAQQWLLQSDLALNIAFNLDGGKSTMMIVRPASGETLHIPALAEVPIVLAVYGG